MWNDEIKQNIINELNEQLDSISPVMPAQNHSYADSIFSSSVSNMFKPIDIENYSIPNYYERTINSMRTIKEVPVHTMAFADSFNDVENTKYDYTYDPVTNYGFSENSREYESVPVCYMDSIVKNPNTITFSLSPERRKVAIAKKATWKDVMFNDVSLIGNTSIGRAIKNFCSIQIKL